MRIVCLLVIALLTGHSIKAEKPKSDVQLASGWYTCEGTTPAGKKYHNLVSLRQVKNVYIVNWIDEDSVVTGIGVVSGNQFTIGYSQPDKDKKLIQSVQGMIIEGGTLSGKWASHPGDGELHPEEWKFLKAFPPKEEPDEKPKEIG